MTFLQILLGSYPGALRVCAAGEYPSHNNDCNSILGAVMNRATAQAAADSRPRPSFGLRLSPEFRFVDRDDKMIHDWLKAIAGASTINRLLPTQSICLTMPPRRSMSLQRRKIFSIFPNTKRGEPTARCSKLSIRMKPAAPWSLPNRLCAVDAQNHFFLTMAWKFCRSPRLRGS